MKRRRNTSRNSIPIGFDPDSTRGDIFLQPWFIPKDIYLEIRRLLPSVHLAKMRYYFEDFGCLKCGERKKLYGSNGFCEGCGVLIRGRVKRSLERRLKAVGVNSAYDFSSSISDPVTTARKLVGSIKARRFKASPYR
jgi:hypothetical protein